ncbi:MAG: chitinase [Paucimonas sp.]|nr:chitinase [Paucimonas sp.]
MTRLKRMLAVAGLLAFSSVFQAAHACTPWPARILNPTTAEEAKFPLVKPSTHYDTKVQPCPYTVWPFVYNSMSDADVVKYLGGTSSTPVLDPAWSASKVYYANDRASYNSKNYKARWWTQGEVPGSVAVWEELPDAYGNPPAWSATVGYSASSRVSYNAYIYSAKWWTQGETPGLAGNVWTFAAGAYALADSWQVRVNGIVVQNGTAISTLVADCAPTTPSCVARYAQRGSFTVTSGYNDQVTFWLCKGGNCRPTPRASWLPYAVDKVQ